ncbi:MAG: RHS repeat protein [Candidatus Rokubacteria bacterium]|nr:RHS repeat protein [Candidatus Rokubacteria bacterium]
MIDGRSASGPGRRYGVFEVGVVITAGQTIGLGYTVWMPRIDTAHAVTIPTQTATALVITTPRIPGLELRLPAHSSIRDHEGAPATEISTTPIPQDRPPFPLPQGSAPPAYFTIQPGAGYISNPDYAGAQLVYPNRQQARAGTRFEFCQYDPRGRGWHVYGHGTVMEDGRQIVPDPKVAIYEFTGAMAADPGLGYAPALAGARLSGGDPVDLATGLFVLRKTDLVVPDLIPIVLTRTYRPGDGQSRAFGFGMSHSYDMFLVGDVNPYTYLDLFLPDGTRIHFARISPGGSWPDAVYEHTATPTRFHKARIVWNESHVGWDLTLKDGTLYQFPEANGAPRPQWAALKGYRDRYGNALTLTRDSNRDLTRLTTPSGRWVALTVDASHRITQAQDNTGRTVSYTYDAGGRLSTVTDAAGGVTTYGYDASNRMTTITDARGIAYLTNEYDATGKVIRQSQPGGIVHQLAYTLGPGGIVTQTDVTDPRGGIERAAFNDAGYPVSDTRALGAPEQQATSYEWQAATNLLLAQTDALGRRTAYAYDTNANLSSLTRLAGTGDAVTTGFSYEPLFSQVASVTDPLGHTTTLAYDAAGNPTTITTPLGVATTLTYTAAGQPLTITTPAGTTQLGYDGGDLVSITDPLGRTTTRFTDSAGRLVSVTDPRGSQTRYAYDALNRLTSLTDALGGVTQFGYDPNGNLLTLTDARGSVTGYSYDAMDRVATRSDPLLRVESYQYDLAGNLTQVTDRKSQVTTVSYDVLNRRTGATYADASTTTYGYDAGNRLRTVTDSLAGTLTLTYDTLDRLTQEVSAQGTVSYGYDAAGRRTSLGILGQPAVTYGYDAADRLLQITKGSALVAFGYDAADRRTLLTLPNGVTTEYTYDVASQLTGLTYKKGAATLGALTYAYDAAGNRTQASGSWARTGLPDPITSASYNAANHQLALGGRAMTYDLAGNLLTLAEPTGTTTFTWDARNQLSAMTTPDGTASFLYDGLGRRRAKILSGTRTDYLYDGLTPVQELAGATVTANLLTGLGIDEYFTRTTGTTTRTLLTDALGSTVALTDDTGALQAEYTYEPFGATTETGVDSNPFQYTGRELDAGTGLYYYRARYYHPGLQRFISEDPIEFAGGDMNLYAYVFNDPVNAADPSGTVRIETPPLLASMCRGDLLPGLGGRKDPSILERVVGFARDLVGDSACDPNNLLPGPGMVTGPTKGMLKAFGNQLAKHGRGSLGKSLATLERRLAEHLGKLADIEKAGEPPGSVQREIRNFQAQIAALRKILENLQ